MKALVYGSERTTKKLSGLLADEGIEVTVMPEGHFNTGDWQKGSRFDLAIIDSFSNTVESACRSIRESWNTPIALLIDPKQTDWNKLLSLDADCYIQESRESIEMAARLRALLRRYTYRTQAWDSITGINKGISAN